MMRGHEIKTATNKREENELNIFPKQLPLDSGNLPCNKLKIFRTIM
jgi:hypothetical protein